MRGLGLHENIPVSDTKLTLGLRVGFFSSHLRADKHFPVNPKAIKDPPKASLLREVKNTHALIIKPRFILIVHTDNYGWYITRTFKTSTGLSADQILRQSRSCIAPQIVFKLTWCFKKNNFLLTHVWNSWQRLVI